MLNTNGSAPPLTSTGPVNNKLSLKGSQNPQNDAHAKLINSISKQTHNLKDHSNLTTQKRTANFPKGNKANEALHPTVADILMGCRNSKRLDDYAPKELTIIKRRKEMTNDEDDEDDEDKDKWK